MKPLYAILILTGLAACQQHSQEQQASSGNGPLDSLRNAVTATPNNAGLRITYANALLEAEQYAAADSQAVILAKDTTTLDRALYIRALVALSKQDTMATVAHLAKAIGMRGLASEYEAVMMTGDLLLAQQLPDKAKGYYNLAARIDTTQGEPYYGRARCLPAGDPEALKDYQQCMVKSPDFAPAYIGVGRYYEGRSDLKQAFNYYNLAAKADPTDADAYFHRGSTLLKLGNRPAGMDDLTKALSFRKGFPSAAKMLDSVKALPER